MLGVLIALLLILGNGFFVAAEFALVASERSRIENMAQEGHRGAIGTLKALRQLSFQLSGAQLGITITSLVLGYVVQPTVGAALEPAVDAIGWVPSTSVLTVSTVAALVLATSTQMIVSELIPQNIAIARPLRTAFLVNAPLRFFNAIFKPLILFLNSAANAAVRLMGIEPRDELSSVVSLEELEMLIRSSREEGALPQEDFALLARSITFGDKTAADALVPRTSMSALRADATIPELVDLALESGHSRFPVHEGDIDDILGVVHVKDMYALTPEERAKTRVADLMQPTVVVPESVKLDALLSQMRRDRKQLSIVVDEYGGTAGIITLEDLLEEIVGDIADEYDPAEDTKLTPKALDGVAVVSGLLHPDEVLEATGFEVPEGDYDTLAGFLLSRFDRIPGQGDHTSHEGWELKVVEMDGNRISQILVVAPPATPPEEES